MRRFSNVGLVLAAMFFAPMPAKAEKSLNVIVSIKPVHSLVAGVMGDTGTPGLIVDGAASPHTYSLQPGTAKALQQADAVFWIGPEFETFLTKPLETIAEDAHIVSLFESPGMTHHGLRGGAAFERHVHHEEEGHEEGDDHDHGDEHGEEHEHADEHANEHAEEHEHEHEDEHADEHDHESGHEDQHVWLDPHNAKALVEAIRLALSSLDPDRKGVYQANADALSERLDGLVAQTEQGLASVKDGHFMVFHDAYQYFEKRFGMTAVGSITINPEIRPSAERVRTIRERIVEHEVACVFSEPQFEPRIVSIVIEGSKAQSAVLDPLGSSQKAGPDQYFEMIESMVGSFQSCLSHTG